MWEFSFCESYAKVKNEIWAFLNESMVDPNSRAPSLGSRVAGVGKSRSTCPAVATDYNKRDPEFEASPGQHDKGAVCLTQAKKVPPPVAVSSSPGRRLSRVPAVLLV